jgi:hypothetical protein
MKRNRQTRRSHLQQTDPRPFRWLLGCLLLLAVTARAQVTTTADSTKMGNHPRLLLLAGQEQVLNERIRNNPSLQQVHQNILQECDALLGTYPVDRTLIGRRLLDKSREAMRRTFYLAYAWRLTGKKKYFKRCEEELLAISKFSDWNPSHFLDVAEMTMAAAIGYDWLYNDLTPLSRAIISRAILDKGIKASLDPNNNKWLKDQSNWNQVCNTGITYGAIATYEQQPEQTMQLITRALRSIQTPMKVYAENGNYPEGYNYWGYGTTYNVFFISALEKLFGNDFGLTQLPGFLNTAAYYENMVSPANNVFSYSDCAGVDGLQPAMFWFAGRTKDPSVLWNERPMLINNGTVAKWNRFLPAFLIWAENVQVKDITPPRYTLWTGKGDNPVAVLHTSWEDPNSIYVGFKGGSPSNSHGHMDAGSFVMDAEGVRWSIDLGMQGYESLESKGIRIWDASQNGQRWQVMRYNNRFHSTLTVNDGLQDVKGRATITTTSADTAFTRAVANLQPVYPSLVKAQRGVAIVNKQYVMVRDEVETGDSACVLRWSMVTTGTVQQQDKNTLHLGSKGKKLLLYIHGAPEAETRTWTTDPVNSWDALNPGTMVVGYEITIPPHTRKEITVFLLPGEQQLSIRKSSLKPLDQW